MNKQQRFFHLHLISDATGETLLAAGRAASAQYKDARAIEHIYPLIRTERQILKVLEEIDETPGIVLYTVVDHALARLIDSRCAEMGLPCVSVLEPILTVFQSYLGAPAGRRVGAQHVLDADYFRRIDALNFTMEHDDGQLANDVEDADVILIGISAVVSAAIGLEDGTLRAALVVFLVFVFIYIAVRFDREMSIASMASIDTGWRIVGRLLASRPNGSLVLTPSMRMALKRVFWPPAEISPRPLSVWARRGSRRM